MVKNTLVNAGDTGSIPGPPTDYSVHGILQARMLESVALSLPGDSPDPGIEPLSQASPILVDGFFTTSTTWASHSPLTAFQIPS